MKLYITNQADFEKALLNNAFQEATDVWLEDLPLIKSRHQCQL